jgi:tRNA-intron endonuclease
MCLLVKSKAVVETKRLKDQLQQKGFGERTEGEYVLDLFETLYLKEKKKIKVRDNKGKALSKKDLIAYSERREKDFFTKYAVYRDLRNRGFCVKTGFKFGFDFRVYPRGKKPGQAHTEKVIQVTKQSDRFSMTELSRMVRLAGNIRTSLEIAVVDSENDINYYKTERVVP